VHDLRYAIRAARREPLVFTVATAVLALAIAASTAVFSLVDAVLLRPLPLAEPDRLIVAWESSPAIGAPFMEVSYPNYLDWQSQSRQLEAVADMETSNRGFIIAGDEPVDVPGRLVSGNFFDVLGVRAFRGGRLVLLRLQRYGVAHVVESVADGRRRSGGRRGSGEHGERCEQSFHHGLTEVRWKCRVV